MTECFAVAAKDVVKEARQILKGLAGITPKVRQERIKTQLLPIVFILTACTSKEVKKPPIYQVINEMWSQESSIEDLKNKLGSPDLVNGKVAEYMFPNTKVPKMHFQFNVRGKLESALIFLDQTKLQEFKNFIASEWIEKTGKKQTADFIDKTYEGQCKSKPIRISYFSSLNSYQVLWDKK